LMTRPPSLTIFLMAFLRIAQSPLSRGRGSCHRAMA
jgi:hypothetical protein